MNIPSPETLRPLLEAALNLMVPNDPAREHLTVCANLGANRAPYLCVYFYSYAETPRREANGSGATPGEALENFRNNYQPLTKEGKIAALKAELEELEGGK